MQKLTDLWPFIFVVLKQVMLYWLSVDASMVVCTVNYKHLILYSLLYLMNFPYKTSIGWRVKILTLP